jgi:hypothetical protein
MPYIKQHHRDILNPVLRRLVDKVGEQTCPYLRSEAFGAFAGLLVRRFIYGRLETHESVTPEVDECIEELGKLIDAKQLFVGAGQLNYSITYVLWGLLGDDARYGLRAYLNGVLGLVRKHLDINEDFESEEDPVLIARRYVIAYGVLTDISEETYRRKTVPYEESKLTENGDVSREEPVRQPAKELDAWENEGGNGARHGRFGRIKQDEPEV